ncbi:helix-turn-helix domain-containing protein [Streptomyces griseosporeus]|uniref:hypothetical protein n=1 Tax=Streptomyces griseosporeus TaxID=1910 RepID=UPI0036A5F3E7
MTAKGRSPRRAAVLAALRASSASSRKGQCRSRTCSGLAAAEVRPSTGRGRPRTVYTPRRGMDRGGTRGYRLLARMLLGRLAADGAEPGGAATEAGRA